jgi:hypothetical protein
MPYVPILFASKAYEFSSKRKSASPDDDKPLRPRSFSEGAPAHTFVRFRRRPMNANVQTMNTTFAVIWI